MSYNDYYPTIFMEVVKIEAEGNGQVKVTFKAEASTGEMALLVTPERAASIRIGEIVGIDYRTSANGPKSQGEKDLSKSLEWYKDAYNKIGGDARYRELFPRKAVVFGMATLEPMGSEA